MISPFFVASIMYLISVAVAWCNATTWHVSMHPETVLVILLGLGALGLGEAFTRNFAPPVHPSFTRTTPRVLRVSSGLIAALTIFTTLTLIVYATETYRLANTYGTADTFSKLIAAARQAKLEGLRVSALAGHLYFASQAISCVMMSMFLNNRVLCRYVSRRDLLMLMPVVLLCATALLSTGRTYFMYQIITYLVLAAVMVYRRNGWVSTDNGKIARMAGLAVLLFAIAFVLLGEARSTHIESFNSLDPAALLETAALYVGGSIAALNQFLLTSTISNDANFFGSNTLFGLFSLLRTLGYSIPSSSPPLEMTYLAPDVFTNVYTPLRRYLQDFGLVGMIGCMFTLGAGYGLLLRRVQRTGSNLSAIVFAALFYPVVEIAIEERLFMDVLTAGTLYFLLYLWAIYHFLTRQAERGV